MEVNYNVVSQNTSMGNELKWLLREGDVGMFSRALSLENRPTPFKSRPTLFKIGSPKYSKSPDITDW